MDRQIARMCRQNESKRDNFINRYLDRKIDRQVKRLRG